MAGTVVSAVVLVLIVAIVGLLAGPALLAFAMSVFVFLAGVAIALRRGLN